jgi:hypothetical protein
VSEPTTCVEIEALAAEVALGSLSGPDRASALAHLARCPGCRRLVDDLSRAADPVLLLAPDMEPSIGFESRVLAATTGPQSPEAVVPAPRPRLGPRPRAAVRAVALAAAALVAAAAGMMAGSHLSGGGDVIRTAVAVSPSGNATCRAFAYGERQAWVFVTFEGPREWTADYTVEITTEGGGSPLATGQLRLQDGGGTLGTVVDVPASRLKAVRVLDSSGALRYEAPFTKP